MRTGCHDDVRSHPQQTRRERDRVTTSIALVHDRLFDVEVQAGSKLANS